jgi:hypothetical protein
MGHPSFPHLRIEMWGTQEAFNFLMLKRYRHNSGLLFL